MTEEQDWSKVTMRGINAQPQQPHSQCLQQVSEQPSSSQSLSLQRPVSEGSITTQSNITRPLFPGLKKIQIKKEDHSVRYILYGVLFVLFVILAIDIKSEIQRQQHRHELQAQHCYAEYQENECFNPIDAMRQKCKELQICYSTSTNLKIKVTSILAKLVGKAVHTCANSAGLAGCIFLLSLIFAILFFAYKSSKATMTLKKD